jgi:hypothetical protein
VWTPMSAWSAWLGPGQDRAYALAAEVGVGTYGGIDGAIRSGERAAREVLAI